MRLEPNFYPNLPRADYDQIDAHNFSRLKYLGRSPMAYRYHCDNPCEPTAPMILGNAAHLAILEPSMANFAVWSGPGRRFGKEWDAWCCENTGKTLLNNKEAAYVAGIKAAVHANPTAHRYLRLGKREHSMVWRDLTFRRDFKARIDNLIELDGESVLVSLKTTTDCRDFCFAAQYYKRSYHVQDAIYQNGFFYLTGELPRMVTIAVESEPPHETAVYNIPNDVLRQGQSDLAKWLETLRACEMTNTWPAAVEGEQDLTLPSYAYPGGDFDMEDLEPIAR